MFAKKLQKYLDESGVKYEVKEHRKVYTAYDAAATMKVKLKQIAKSLIVKFNKPFVDGQKPYALVIVGADRNIDLKKLSKVVSDTAVKLNRKLRLKKPDGIKRSGHSYSKVSVGKTKKLQLDIYNKVAKVTIPKEKDLKDKLKIKPGTAAAFGSLYKLPVFVDKNFAKQAKALFSSGSFTESVEMAVKSFVKLEEAVEGNFSMAKRPKPQKIQKARKSQK